MDLTPAEVRVLGALLEKSATTPDHYPLTTNALITACNQKSSREPVVDYDERTVTDAIYSLRNDHQLARSITGGGRTVKHRHVLDEAWGLDADARAVLAVLALRGPQTPGELRTRTERYVGFESVEQVDEVLDVLAARPEPLVVDLGRRPGQSQNRWTHLLSGPVEADSPSEIPEAPTPGVAELSELVARLEARVERLESELGL